MALVYLVGSDIESTKARERATLLGIANETYVYCCNSLGNDYHPNCDTKYCFSLKEFQEAVLDENNDPVLDELGNPTYQGTGDFAIEVNTLQAEYKSLRAEYIDMLVDRSIMETNGWFANE